MRGGHTIISDPGDTQAQTLYVHQLYVGVFQATMKYIKTLNKCGEGGSCANCGNGYTGTGFKSNGMREKGSWKPEKQGFMVMVEFNNHVEEYGEYFREPVNLCRDCWEKIKVKGEL